MVYREAPQPHAEVVLHPGPSLYLRLALLALGVGALVLGPLLGRAETRSLVGAGLFVAMVVAVIAYGALRHNGGRVVLDGKHLAAEGGDGNQSLAMEVEHAGRVLLVMEPHEGHYALWVKAGGRGIPVLLAGHHEVRAAMQEVEAALTAQGIDVTTVMI